MSKDVTPLSTRELNYPYAQKEKNQWIANNSPYAEYEVQLHTISVCCNKMQMLMPTRNFPNSGVAQIEHPFLITSQKTWDNIKDIIHLISNQMGLTYIVEGVYYTENAVKVSWQK